MILSTPLIKNNDRIYLPEFISTGSFITGSKLP